MWRLHRRQLAFAAGALGVVAVVLVVTGLRMHANYHDALLTCTRTGTCADLADTLFQGDGFIFDLVLATVAIPLLFGMFWGAPMVSREVEERTHDLVWTQSVSRGRWLGSNITATVLVAAAWGAVLAGLVSWWRVPENAIDTRLGPGVFDIQGVLPVAASVFAVALGIAAGTWMRRVLPAVATTLGVFVAIRVAMVVWLRRHLLTPVHRTFALVNNSFGAPAGSWIQSRDVIDPTGRVVTKNGSVLAPCSKGISVSIDCLARSGFRRSVTYLPAGRFWTLQAIEAAILLALSVALVVAAYWRCTRADA
jgi:hypothetical protein